MTDAFDADWWERHYQDHGTGTGHDRPSEHLVAELATEAPGTALDAGCGTGADAVWLAAQGWQVTAVDVSPTAIERARQRSGDVDWQVRDLSTWEPPRQYGLVVSQYVHPGIPFGDFVARLARAVEPGGLLVVSGHDHADEHSAAHAPEDASVGADAITGALGAGWDVESAGTRTREVGGVAMHDVVVKARRR